MTPLQSDYHSLKAQKSIENSSALYKACVTSADAGPVLENDDKRIRIPSPGFHEEFVKILKERGFRYFNGALPHWYRDTGKVYQGKVYSSAAWLAWARERYAWAWKGWSLE